MAKSGTENFSTQYWGMEKWPSGRILGTMFEDQLASLVAVRDCLGVIEGAADAATDRLRGGGGRLIYAGAGTSARLGVQDGVELVPTYSWPESRLDYLIAGGLGALTRSIEGAEDDSDAGRRDAANLNIGAADVLIAVSASGATPYTIAACQAGKDAGAVTIGIANNASPLLDICAYPILAETGPEPIGGSTRMKAGSAQKIVLNLISTLIMIRLGRVFGGLMVDMLATNDKLRDRARRMVAQITGDNETDVGDALNAADWNVKLAVLVQKGVSAKDGQELLDGQDGDLGQVLEKLSPEKFKRR